MVVDTSKETIKINKIVFEKEETFTIDEDMIVPDSKPDILSIIETSGNICIYKKELMENKLKIDGGINAYIMYMSDNSEDNARGINANLDFSKVIDAPNCKDNMILEMETKIKEIECNVINGRKINIQASVNIMFKVYLNENIDFIDNITNNEDIKTLKKQIDINSLVGYGSTKAYAKETLKIDNTDNLAEILKMSINLVDKDIKTSYNKILAKTEAEIEIIYLTEDNKVVSCSNRIPLVGFIDIPNVSEENECDTTFEIKNMLIKPNNVDEHSIYVELELEVSCIVYEEKNIHIIDDLYSPIQDIKCNKKEIKTISNKSNRTEKCHLSETVNIQNLENSSIVNVECVPKITNVNCLDSRISYEGDLELDFILLVNDNQIIKNKSVIPFEFSIDNIVDGKKLNITTSIDIGETEFVKKNDNEIAVEVNMIFNVGMNKNEVINVIDDIMVEENSEIEDYSLIIYIVKPGDTLWNIAKKLRSTVDDITRTNGIEDEKNIQVGEKLYIPRYVKYA